MLRALILMPVLFLFGSCFVISHDYDGSREVTPGTVLTTSSAKVGDFKGSERATFLFWGLMPLNKVSGPRLAEELALQQDPDVTGVTHLKIHQEANALDVIVTLLTLGIFAMESIEVQGEAHAAEGGMQ